MQLEYMRAACFAVGLCAACAAGLPGSAGSLPNWTVLAACAVLTPLVVKRYWNQPALSMAQTIQEVRR